MQKVEQKVLFGAELAAISLGGDPTGSNLVVQTWSPTVPFSLGVASTTPTTALASKVAAGQYVFPVSRGVETCARARLELGGAYGPWSANTCATPSADTTAPRLTVRGDARRHGRWLTVDVDVSDESPHRARGELQAMLGLAPSGSLQVRVGESSDLERAVWVAYEGPGMRVRTTRALRQARRLWVQARDGNGNVSVAAPMVVPSRAETLVDKAIALEEDALDETSEHVVRKRVRQSIPRLRLAGKVARGLAGSHELRAEVDALVGDAVELKQRAILYAVRGDLTGARQLLETALGVELELATLIDQLGGRPELNDRAFAEDGEAE